MNSQQTFFQLKKPKLNGITSSLRAILSLPAHKLPTLEVAIAKLTYAVDRLVC